MTADLPPGERDPRQAAGAEKALLWRINPLSAVLLGGVTAVGGGSVRDILLNDVPPVRTQVCALAALLGAAVSSSASAVACHEAR